MWWYAPYIAGRMRFAMQASSPAYFLYVSLMWSTRERSQPHGPVIVRPHSMHRRGGLIPFRTRMFSISRFTPAETAARSTSSSSGR